jgi:hypothetical protein
MIRISIAIDEMEYWQDLEVKDKATARRALQQFIDTQLKDEGSDGVASKKKNPSQDEFNFRDAAFKSAITAGLNIYSAWECANSAASHRRAMIEAEKDGKEAGK